MRDKTYSKMCTTSGCKFFKSKFSPSLLVKRSSVFSIHPMFTTAMIIGLHYAERLEPIGQINKKYPSMGIYTLIYTIARESTTSRCHNNVSFPHDSIIFLVQIHIKYINLLRLQWLVWMSCKHHLKVNNFYTIASSSLWKYM